MMDFLSKSNLEDPNVQEAIKRGLETASVILKDLDMDDNPIFKEMLDGQTMAQAMGLNRDDLEVIYTLGFNLMVSGKLDQAEDTFITLCMMDMLEAKNHYCLGVTRQLKQNWKMAYDDFVRFLSLDATNPEGYLRAGECMMALGDRDEARDLFELALAEAQAGNGPEHALEQAQKALDQFQMEK